MKDNIAIVGAGNLGTGLAHALSSKGYKVKLGVRDLISEPKLINSDAIDVCSLTDAVANADLTLLTVPDSAITSVCESLSTKFKKGSVVAHCSGAVTSDALASAQIHGCLVASAHPLNTFPNPTAAIELLNQASHNTSLYCEGDQQALTMIERTFYDVGFNYVEINAESKPLYHAACVFACNYLTVLMDLSLQTAEAAELNRESFWDSIQPLLQSTLKNITKHGTTQALSGPVARADTETIELHAEQLKPVSTDLHDSYLSLAAQAADLALKSDALDQQKAQQLKSLIKLITHKS